MVKECQVLMYGFDLLHFCGSHRWPSAVVKDGGDFLKEFDI